MPHNKKNVPAKWSEARELAPGIKEKVKYDPKTGRFENIIIFEGRDEHYHGWTDPERGEAGGEINKNH